jgi:hypothetical protein
MCKKYKYTNVGKCWYSRVPGPKVQVNYCHHLASVVCKLHISSFFSETTGPIGTKLSRNVPHPSELILASFHPVVLKNNIFKDFQFFDQSEAMTAIFKVSPICPRRSKCEKLMDDRYQTPSHGRHTWYCYCFFLSLNMNQVPEMLY